jgi:hypothetical protein
MGAFLGNRRRRRAASRRDERPRETGGGERQAEGEHKASHGSVGRGRVLDSAERPSGGGAGRRRSGLRGADRSPQPGGPGADCQARITTSRPLGGRSSACRTSPWSKGRIDHASLARLRHDRHRECLRADRRRCRSARGHARACGRARACGYARARGCARRRGRRRDGGRRLPSVDRIRCRRRLGAGRRDRRSRCPLGPLLPPREERQRIDVPVRFGRQPYSQMDVCHGMLGLARRADGADDVALGDRRADADGDRAEVDERDREPIRGANREREAGTGHEPRKADTARRRGPYLRSRRSRDVDPAMLSTGVRVVVGLKAAKHRPVDRPGPGTGRRSREQREHERAQQHHAASVARFANHGRPPYQGGRMLSNLATARRDRAGCGRRRSAARRSRRPAGGRAPRRRAPQLPRGLAHRRAPPPLRRRSRV